LSRRIDLLRLDYAFSVIVPCLMAVYFNKLNLFNELDIIVGFLLYAITGNLLNDAIDVKDPGDVETAARVEGYRAKELAAMALLSVLFGTFLFIRTCIEHPLNIVFLIATVIMVIGYCVKFKKWVIVNQILLGISHVVFPYFMIKVDGGVQPLFTTTDLVLLLTFFAFAYTGQIVHEIIDGDSITRFSMETQRWVVLVSSFVAIGVGIWANIVIWPNWGYVFVPFIFIPFGTIYIFRRAKPVPKGVKDVGIVLGNIIMVYFLVFILQNMHILGML
jgi:4-hydroxybenzoate polyprenyltransferase